MSKKDKSKFRKRLKTQLLKKMAQSPRTPASVPPSVSSSSVLPAPQRPPENTQMPLASSTVSETLALTEPVVLVQKDLKKSPLIIGSCFVLVFVVFFFAGGGSFFFF